MIDIKSTVCSFEKLYNAMQKCRRGVGWKDSTIGFVRNGLANCRNLSDELMTGKYKIGAYSTFVIHEPKERIITSTRFRDRVFQRSLCDNYLYTAISKSFIYDNCACQIGKGSSFARDRLREHLARHYRKHGRRGYVLKCDVSAFFASIDHQQAINAVKRRVEDLWVFERVADIINSYEGSKGLGLGSQITQLVALAMLDDLDHLIKEHLHVRGYVRYMDDFILISESKERLQQCRKAIEEYLHTLGLELSKKKTQLFPLSQPVKFLGFAFRLTETGKVIVKIASTAAGHERRKLKRMAEQVKSGIIPKSVADNCFRNWKAHARQGNTFNLVRGVNDFYNDLW